MIIGYAVMHNLPFQYHFLNAFQYSDCYCSIGEKQIKEFSFNFGKICFVLPKFLNFSLRFCLCFLSHISVMLLLQIIRTHIPGIVQVFAKVTKIVNVIAPEGSIFNHIAIAVTDTNGCPIACSISVFVFQKEF